MILSPTQSSSRQPWRQLQKLSSFLPGPVNFETGGADVWSQCAIKVLGKEKIFTILDIYWKCTARAKFDTEEKTWIAHCDQTLAPSVSKLTGPGKKEDNFWNCLPGCLLLLWLGLEIISSDLSWIFYDNSALLLCEINATFKITNHSFQHYNYLVVAQEGTLDSEVGG